MLDHWADTTPTRRFVSDGTSHWALLSEGEDWKLQRRTVAPALGPRVMPLLSGHVMASAREALDGLDGEPAIDLLAFLQTQASHLRAVSPRLQ